MKISVEIIIIMLFITAFIDFALILRMIINKLKRNIKKESDESLESDVISHLNANRGLENFRRIADGMGIINRSIKLDMKATKALKDSAHDNTKITKLFLGLKSPYKKRRVMSTIKLGYLKTDSAVLAIEQALIKEKDVSVRLNMANTLSDIGAKSSIPVLVNSLIGEKKWYREKVNMLIADLGKEVFECMPDIFDSNEIEIMDLIVDCASLYPTDYLKEYIFKRIDNFESDKRRILELNNERACENCRWVNKTNLPDKIDCKRGKIVNESRTCRRYSHSQPGYNDEYFYDLVLDKATDVAGKFYFTSYATDKYLESNNSVIKNKAIKALGMINSKFSILKLKSYLKEDKFVQSALQGISELIDKNSNYIDIIADLLHKEKDLKVKQRLAEAVSGKIEFFIMRLPNDENGQAQAVIKEILMLGRTSEFIGFINNNKDIDIENRLVSIIRQIVSLDDHMRRECCVYLRDRVLKKAKLERLDNTSVKKERQKDEKLTSALYVILVLIILIFPAIYLMRYFSMITIWSWMKQMKTYVVDFNYYLVFYSLLINLSYIVLLLLSRINVSKQSLNWEFKSTKMLFKKRMLPGVSIIAPAYNEEMTIIESANSLLNLKYPDYDLVIVNDGSKDETLHVLIDYFNLKRIDYSYDVKLNFEPVRGIYANASFPKLLVVDKENGGKADSLNAGIVISKKEYFCCIDSDSLLEEESLLKLASQTLDESVETPALGGNVFPINGCTVSRGYISDKQIPKNAVARFQTIEYIRAFMAGRLGFAYVNGLLIISGAFGLFRKERVIDIGGYLTGNGEYKTDTVGEDMELVVRITHQMRKKGHKYKVNYCYNANCWTEVPEQLSQLKKQRYRWCRGLIETLHFHRETLFNPRYGRMGMLSMPYFFIFEMVGPLIEVQGYLMVVVAAFLGILIAQVALLLFLTSVMLGVFVSIMSLMIAEKDNNYYSFKDVMTLVGVAVIENFGPRQFFSFWRVIGYFKMFAKPQGWGEQKRKGFSAN